MIDLLYREQHIHANPRPNDERKASVDVDDEETMQVKFTEGSAVSESGDFDGNNKAVTDNRTLEAAHDHEVNKNYHQTNTINHDSDPDPYHSSDLEDTEDGANERKTYEAGSKYARKIEKPCDGTSSSRH